MSYTGIDYGRGMTNIDHTNAIRYGVINQHVVGSFWFDEAESVYPCDECDAFVDGECTENCPFCEPIGFKYERDGYAAWCGEDGDIFVTKSPFYTYAQFCSPCAPGACYLTNAVDEENEGNKAYCFGQDLFDDDNPCPYDVWRVDTGEKIYTPA